MNMRKLSAGVFLLSVSLLTFELTLIRVYSATLFYHFAFMAISVAMLGLAAAGLTVHRFPGAFSAEKIERWAPLWSGAYAVSLVAVLWIAFRIPVNAYQPPDAIADRLTAIYLLSAIPFYFAGLVFSGLFASLASMIGRLYSWDLIGAGVGAVMIIPLLNWAGGETGPFFIAAAGLGAAALFASKKRWVVPAALMLGMLILGLANNSLKLLEIKYSKGQSLEGFDVKYNRWNSISRIMAIPFRPGTDAAYTWCPSPNYPLPILPHLSLMIDDGAATPVLPFDGKNLEPVSYLMNDLTALSHRLHGDGNTLVIGCGGGRDVLTGLMAGARQIDAVDINPLIFDAMNRALASFNGSLYYHPKVKGIVSEGRAFARRSPGKYDLIQVAMIDTWAATTTGAYSLTENSLYTIEAFEDYLKALKPEGMLSFTRFFFEPPRQTLKLVSLYLAAAERMGIASPDSCILVAKYESLATVIFKGSPFSRQEIAKFRADVADLGFEIVYTPDYRPNPYFRTLIESKDRDAFYSKYAFDIRPNTDERPFFFNLLKMKNFLRVFEVKEGQKFNYYATYTLIVLLFVAALATIATLLLPTLLWGDKLPKFAGRGELLGYFTAIGLAYIMIETALLQRFVLFLEQPAYAASAVVAGMLIASGLGSLYWHRTDPRRRGKLIELAFSVIYASLGLHILLGNQLIHWFIPLPLTVKVVIAALLILPLGFAMGIPLPAAMGLADKKGPATVAWCWAVNGSASVVASPLAVTLAMAAGFGAALTAGALAYTLAFLLLLLGVLKRPDFSRGWA